MDDSEAAFFRIYDGQISDTGAIIWPRRTRGRAPGGGEFWAGLRGSSGTGKRRRRQRCASLRRPAYRRLLAAEPLLRRSISGADHHFLLVIAAARIMSLIAMKEDNETFLQGHALTRRLPTRLVTGGYPG